MIGKSLAHYVVLDRIGEGGMGEVYRARDTTLDREVALKMLAPHFVADAERIARLDDQDGVRFLAMELVDGPDHSQRLTQGPIPVEEALPVAERIAEALEYAHEHNIVHRDLKPANIKLGRGGVKILDFGLAKAFAPDSASGAPTSGACQGV